MIGIIGAFASVSQISDATARGVVTAVCITITVAAIYLFVSTYVNILNSIHNLRVLKSLRIKRLFTNGTDATHSMRAAIRGSKSVSIMAVSAESLIKSLKDEIIYALRENSVNIRVLLATPHSQFVSDVEETESIERIGHITPEITKVESLLKEYLSDAKANANANTVVGQIWLGNYSTHLRSSMVLCDNFWGWFTLNLPPRRAVQSPSFELEYGEGSLFKICSQHFDRVWELMKSSDKTNEITIQRGSAANRQEKAPASG